MQAPIHQITLRSAARLLMLLLPALCAAQQESLQFDHITSEQGLSDNYVLCAMQDRYGYMWFGTRDGLNRYDGHTFTIYRHQSDDPGSISDGSVNCIFEDSDGAIWIGTHSRGLNRFDPISERFIHYQHDPNDDRTIPSGRVISICEDAGHNLWIATTEPGLARLDPSRRTATRYHHDPADPGSLSSDKVNFVARDAHGAIWVSTGDGGINRYDPATGRFINGHHIARYSFDSLGPVGEIYPDAQERIWLRDQGTIRALDIRTNTYDAEATSRMAGIAGDFISAMHRDRAGDLWAGTLLGGVVTLGGSGELRRYRTNPTLPYSITSNMIFCIAEDRAGNLWIGGDRGISRLDYRSASYRHYHHDPLDSQSLAHDRVRSILEDTRGELWIGTGGGGLDRIGTDGTIHHYRNNPRDRRSLSQNTVNVIYQDRHGDLWIGTNDGLNRYDRATDGFVRHMYDSTNPSGPRQGGFWAILEDRDGAMWIGQLNGGLSRFDRRTGRFTYYLHDPRQPNSPTSDKILCMLEDRDGMIWVGTDDGVTVLDRRTGRFTRLRHDQNSPGSLNNDRVWYIHQDHRGTLWFGTSGGGVSRYSRADRTFRAYTSRDGLAHNTVCGILEDDRGKLWISTNMGLSRFDPLTETFTNYTASDGLHISEFHFKTCFRHPGGAMYFGGINGVIRFHPDSLVSSGFTPEVVLTSFKVFDTELPLDTAIGLKREIHLEHGSNFFSIEFAALDLTNPLANSYAYRLEGFDHGWRRTGGTRPVASYTDVPPGHYRFHVRGSSSEGVWSPRSATLMIVIEPALWQTWWFRGIGALAGCVLIGAIGVLRIRAIRRKGEMEQRVVEYRLKALRAQMNPHFIFNSLNSILSFIVNHDAESAHTYLSKFSRLMRLTLESSINESITLADEIASLRFYLELEMLRFDGRFVYEISVDPAIDPRAVALPPMLIQPYAENAIRYGLSHRSSPGRLLIEIRRGENEIVCSIIDNGIGRARAAALGALRPTPHTSRGMGMTRERLEILNALSGAGFSVDIIDLDDNGAPAGTRVDVHIPITTVRCFAAPLYQPTTP